jgi:hypothetical protein
MKKKTGIILAVLVLIIASGAFYVWKFIYNKPHKDVENARPDFTTTAADLIAEFEQNDTLAGKKYNDKVVQFSGTIHSVIPGDSLSSLVFDEEKNLTITVEFMASHNDVAKNLKAGTGVNVKAEYKGCDYDPLLAEFGEKGNIRLMKGSLVKEN